ncbi:hypothetical protein [Bradyrhizobium sp.]|uniref:hypothetical protein n=1 Tax=Bradyrhizobium sp. TaxID=376 RepID=UPI002D393761|nr:hypothetical protein [Bradyrhizobium sp.]HZR76096.1 hypothetical protein [Bradyrhizobium sp.]
MKRSALTIISALMLMAGGLTAAKAVEFDVGPGGVRVDPYHRHYYRDYGDRDYGGGCRTIIRHHTNRYGEDVTVRDRVCD